MDSNDAGAGSRKARLYSLSPGVSVRWPRDGSAVIPSDSMGESVAVAGGTVVVVAVTVLGASAADDTAPILAFVGAILVAFIAAYTAGRRQKRALEAESGRLAQQLEHDRELADLDSVRAALEDAALALHHVGELPLAVFISDEDPDRVVALAEGEIAHAVSRLTVRFGPQHPVVEAFRACESQIWEWILTTPLLPSDVETEADRERVKRLNTAAKEFREAWKRFLEVAAKTAGARLP